MTWEIKTLFETKTKIREWLAKVAIVLQHAVRDILKSPTVLNPKFQPPLL
jgi:hypothetical protein